MCNILFRGKRIDNGKWAYGDLLHPDVYGNGYFIEDFTKAKNNCSEVNPDTIGQYTGMTEFVMMDKSICDKLFDGDIVEVNSRRRPMCENVCIWRDKTTSKYDIECKARAVVKWSNYHGCWILDYDNAYNHNIEKLKGNETSERTVASSRLLYDFGYHGENENRRREHNAHYKWNDIVKIGTVYDKPELLEETK